MTRAYYNEIDPYAAEWLRNLIAAELIAHGDVDTRSIEDVTPSDLRGYTQCHFFAGIGVWSHALRRAGFPDSRPVWTGSCPCQPFSQSGKRGGFSDERHLWPAWYWLIEQCRPELVLGEQVASPDGLAWLDLVLTDLEGANYAAAAVDLCSAGAGAPHIRQRLYFMADAHHAGSQGRLLRRYGADERFAGPGGVARWLADANGGNAGAKRKQSRRKHGQQPQDGGAVRGVGDASGAGHEGAARGGVRGAEQGSGPRAGATSESGAPRELGDASGAGAGRLARAVPCPEGCAEGCLRCVVDSPIPSGATGGFWSDADWIGCRDGKYRPVEPGTFPLAHGAPSRVGRLRAYGNAVNGPLTAEFVSAVMEVLE